jgi:hypothetical protein
MAFGLRDAELKRIGRIVFKLVLKNIQNGATIEEAKEQAFNRMNDDYPVVLAAWIYSIEKRSETFLGNLPGITTEERA